MPTVVNRTLVTEIPAAESAVRARILRTSAHLRNRLLGRPCALRDCRSRVCAARCLVQSSSTGHLPGAVNLPHGRITERNLAEYSPNTLFVVYCGGPHCNGADRAGVRLARLGRPVKKMIGGVEGWKDEGFSLNREA